METTWNDYILMYIYVFEKRKSHMCRVAAFAVTSSFYISMTVRPPSSTSTSLADHTNPKMSTTTSSIDGEAVLEKGMADESRSIMEAIEAASLHSDDRDEESGTHGPTDLEKAPTQTSTRTGHEAMKRIATAQDWDGPDDPGNPLNWPLWWRRYNIIAIAFLGFNVSAATSLISPAVGDIEESFHVSHVAALLPITTTVIGLAVGPVS